MAQQIDKDDGCALSRSWHDNDLMESVLPVIAVIGAGVLIMWLLSVIGLYEPVIEMLGGEEGLIERSQELIDIF